MKRSFILLWLYCVCALCIYAERTDYFLEGLTWKIKSTSLMDNTSKIVSYQYNVGENVIVNGNTFTLIDNVPIRVENDKVWGVVNYQTESETVVLFYDFALQIGDSILDNYMAWEELGEAAYTHVVKVDTINLLNGVKARRLQYDRYRPADIQYIGNIEGFLYPVEGNPMPPSRLDEFICCSLNDNPLYEAYEGSCSETTSFYPYEDIRWKYWVTDVQDEDMNNMVNYEQWVTFDDVVTIDGKKYGYIQTSPVGAMAIREESGRVYAQGKSLSSKGDMLLYDFNLQVGDSIIGNIVDFIEYNYVTRVGQMTLLNGQTARVIYYDNQYRGADIEFVGNIQGFFYPLEIITTCICGPWYTYKCCSLTDEILHEPHDGSCDEILSEIQTEKQDEISIHVEENQLFIQSEEPILTTQIYTTAGQLVTLSTHTLSSHTLPLYSLPAGLYILTATTADGRVIQTRFVK